MQPQISSLRFSAVFAVVCIAMLTVLCGTSSASDESRPSRDASPERYEVYHRFAAYANPRAVRRTGFSTQTRPTLPLSKIAAQQNDYGFPAARSVFLSQWVRIRSQSKLQFGLSFIGEERQLLQGPTRFHVVFESNSGKEVIFDLALSPASTSRKERWRDFDIDLARIAEREGRFRFRYARLPLSSGTAQEESSVAPIWSVPILIAPSLQTPPNVILISLDTVRADRLGCYGYDKPTSPNLDAFARSAVQFEEAIATSSWTLPSHASIFTGVGPRVHGAIHQYEVAIPQEFELLTEVAASAGYRTAGFTGGGYVSARFGFARGFDEYTSNDVYWEKTATTFDAAAEWIEANSDQPLFVFAHTYEAHSPYRPPRKIMSELSPSSPEKVGRIGRTFAADESNDDIITSVTAEEKAHVSDLYDAGIASVDGALGKFLSRLKSLGLYESSLIVLFSDHGEEFWDHDGLEHGRTLYDEVLKVPLIIKTPKTTEIIGKVSMPVSLTGIYPTVCALMNWTPPPYASGPSLLHYMSRGPTNSGPQYTVSELGIRQSVWSLIPMDAPVLLSVRTTSRKYIISPATGREEFYVLEDDLLERKNVAATHPDELSGMRTLLSAYLRDTDRQSEAIGASRGVTGELSDREREQLKALGYLE